MTFVRIRPARAASLLIAGALTACSGSTEPRAVPIQTLSVSGVRVNAATFRSSGEFDLGLIATAADSSAILDESVGIAAQLTNVSTGTLASFSISRDRTTAVSANGADTRAAVLLDNSGSMGSTDPLRLRASAAQLFWNSVLPVRPGNQVALLDFGVGRTVPYVNTRILQSFTANAAQLDSQLVNVRASGGTPLYESLSETITFMTANATVAQNKVILLLSDGQPNTTSTRAAAIAAAKTAGITVHTVGLGPASDLSASASQAAITAVREVADETGGVYAAATTADALAPIFNTLARATSRGQLIGSFRITPVPAAGTRLTGTVTVTSGGRTGTATWSFVAP